MRNPPAQNTRNACTANSGAIAAGRRCSFSLRVGAPASLLGAAVVGRVWRWVCSLGRKMACVVRRRAPSECSIDELGRAGEEYAARYLRRQGFRVVARGVRYARGELDLVAWDGPTLVFVEVKTRISSQRGLPGEAVDQRKQRRMTRAAMLYLKQHRLLNHPCRFDVVAIVWPPASRQPEIELIRNAFEAVGSEGFFS